MSFEVITAGVTQVFDAFACAVPLVLARSVIIVAVRCSDMALKRMAHSTAERTALGKKAPSLLSINEDTRNRHCSDLHTTRWIAASSRRAEARHTPAEPVRVERRMRMHQRPGSRPP